MTRNRAIRKKITINCLWILQNKRNGCVLETLPITAFNKILKISKPNNVKIIM